MLFLLQAWFELLFTWTNIVTCIQYTGQWDPVVGETRPLPIRIRKVAPSEWWVRWNYDQIISVTVTSGNLGRTSWITNQVRHAKIANYEYLQRVDYLVRAQHLLESSLPHHQIAVPLIETPHISSFCDRGMSEHFAELVFAISMVGNAEPDNTFRG
jgi:hypothetical protein